MFFFSCISDSLTKQAGELNQLPTECVGDDFAASLFHLWLLCEPYMPMATVHTVYSLLHTSCVCARETVRPQEMVRHQRGKRGWKSMQPRADFTLSPRADTDYCCCFVFFFSSFPAGGRSSRAGSKCARACLRYELGTRVTLSDAVFFSSSSVNGCLHKV